MSETRDKLKTLSRELQSGDPTVEDLVAATVLMSLVGALAEGGEAMMAFCDFCNEYSRSAIERLTPTDA